MDHDRERRSRTDTWLYFQKCVVNFIRKNTFTDEDCRQPLMQISGLGLGDLCTDDEVHQCIGIINVNGIRSKENGATVGIEENDGCGPYRCIYPTMALLSNSCICNARCILSGRKGKPIKFIKKCMYLQIVLPCSAHEPDKLRADGTIILAQFKYLLFEIGGKTSNLLTFNIQSN